MRRFQLLLSLVGATHGFIWPWQQQQTWPNNPYPYSGSSGCTPCPSQPYFPAPQPFTFPTLPPLQPLPTLPPLPPFILPTPPPFRPFPPLLPSPVPYNGYATPPPQPQPYPYPQPQPQPQPQPYPYPQPLPQPLPQPVTPQPLPQPIAPPMPPMPQVLPSPQVISNSYVTASPQPTQSIPLATIYRPTPVVGRTHLPLPERPLRFSDQPTKKEFLPSRRIDDALREQIKEDVEAFFASTQERKNDIFDFTEPDVPEIPELLMEWKKNATEEEKKDEVEALPFVLSAPNETFLEPIALNIDKDSSIYNRDSQPVVLTAPQIDRSAEFSINSNNNF